MIISHRHKYIFVHIPKTGGTSLAMALEQKVGPDDILIGDTPKAVKRRRKLKGINASGRLWKHARLTDIYGLVTQEQIENYHVFTIVRNPWDRIVSYYSWLRDQSFKNPQVRLAQNLPFDRFVNHQLVKNALSSGATAHYTVDENTVNQCNQYLKLETLVDDAALLGKNLSFKLPDVPHKNASNRQNYASYYSQESQDLIGEIFADDILKFGYQFEST